MLHPKTLLRLSVLLLALLLGLLRSPGALAQEPPRPVSAWRVVELNGVPNRPESFALPDGDVAVSYTHLTLPTNREV